MPKLLLLIGACIAIIVASAQPGQRTILAVFSHPDDEMMIGSVLAKHARLGNHVYVIIATDGKDGTRVTKIPAGDSLARVRQQESLCAFEKLNIPPPIFLHIDRLDTKLGTSLYLKGRKKALKEIRDYIEKLNPDLLITFGPDGEYGHSEHIVTGAIVTEILLTEGWVDKYPLYFPVDRKEDVADNDDLSYIDKKYINLKIVFSEEDEQKAIEAYKCYLSQFTNTEIQEMISLLINDKANTKYFRRFIVAKEASNEFW